jgi:methyl-accepting chemotaxis protein
MFKWQQRTGPQQKTEAPSPEASSGKEPRMKALQPPAVRLSGKRLSNPFRSVGAKLFGFIFLSIVVLVLAVGLISYSTASAIIQEKVSDSFQTAIVQAGQKLGIRFEQYEQKTLDFLVDNQLTSLMKSLMDPSMDDYDRYEAQRSLQQSINGMAITDSNIKGIHLALVNGTILTSSAMATGDFKREELEWYNRAMESRGQAIWLPMVPGGLFDTSNNINSFGITRLITDVSTGTPLGVLLIELKQQTIENALAGLANEETGSHVAILDGEGRYVFNDAVELVQQASSITYEDGADTGLDQNGEPALIARTTVSPSGWTLVGTYPVDVLVAEAGRILDTTWISSLVAALLAILLSFFLVRMISRPLGVLRKLMKEGEQGNLLVRTQFKNRDEFGELGISFNEMMEKITQLVKQTNESAQKMLENANELLEASRKTALSAKEISVATVEIANGASTLAMEAERGNDLTIHIGQQMKGVVEANLQMGASAQEVRAVSDQGMSYLNELMTKTSQTEEKTRQMVEKVDRLKESTSSIRKILDVLNSVTKQTNILSLNATIEAARAGAAGKGFMVVADEIRQLADQSRQSIDVVAQITESIQSEIDETVHVLQEAYPLFQQQITSVKEVNQIFQDVQGKMVEFIRKLDEVTDSIQQLEQSQQTLSEAISNVSAVSQQSSATSEQVASLSSEQLSISEGLVSLAEGLESVSNNLKETLAKFKV